MRRSTYWTSKGKFYGNTSWYVCLNKNFYISGISLGWQDKPRGASVFFLGKIGWAGRGKKGGKRGGALWVME